MIMMKMKYICPTADKLEALTSVGLLTSFSYTGYVEDLNDLEELSSTEAATELP